uniref:F-box domain-containing protein n=1 Tax=Setaria italica TaxID=4555 RepID=K3ZZV2_SETIT
MAYPLAWYCSRMSSSSSWIFFMRAAHSAKSRRSRSLSSGLALNTPSRTSSLRDGKGRRGSTLRFTRIQSMYSCFTLTSFVLFLPSPVSGADIIFTSSVFAAAMSRQQPWAATSTPSADPPLELVLLGLHSPLWLLWAASTCKRWRHVLSSAGFTGRFRTLHNRSPVVAGSYYNQEVFVHPRFEPSTAAAAVDGRHFSLDFVPATTTLRSLRGCKAAAVARSGCWRTPYLRRRQP